MVFTWTAKNVARLSALLADGIALKEIAVKLGTTYKSAQSKMLRMRREVPSSSPSVAPGPLREIRTCVWPLGDPAQQDFRFCGARPLLTRPYCVAHTKIAYHNVSKRELMGDLVR